MFYEVKFTTTEETGTKDVWTQSFIEEADNASEAINLAMEDICNEAVFQCCDIENLGNNSIRISPAEYDDVPSVIHSNFTADVWVNR